MFFDRVFQVIASLEEQEFTEAWGQKAKDTFSDSLIEMLSPEVQKILSKIKVLGPANLPTTERERVSSSIRLNQRRKELLMTNVL